MTVSLVIGIDTGATGAIAFLTPDGDLLDVVDVPCDHVQVGKHSRSRISPPRLLALLKGAQGAHAFLEQPTYRPMRKRNPQTGEVTAEQMGVAGAGAFGESYGVMLMGVVASGCAYTEVRPGVWGRSIKLHGGKDNSRRMAGRLFPAHAGLFARQKDDGRSDAALIGWWGARELRGGQREAA